jgi:signal transduction histidine kinase
MRFWPKSLKNQILLAVALALLLVQTFSAVLLYRAQHERREAALVHSVAMRLFTATREYPPSDSQSDASNGPGQLRPHGHGPPPPELFGGPRTFRIEHSNQTPVRSGEARASNAEEDLREILKDQDIPVDEIAVVRRLVREDPQTLRRLSRRAALLGQSPEAVAEKVMIAGIRRAGSNEWLIVRTPIPAYERALLSTLIAQTLLIYAVLFGVIAWVLRRITRPLAALTTRLEQFAETRKLDGQINPEGPEDVRRLISAHNAMEGRIAGLLDEKDVMLGAIGHDLKTPLAALRVRIESVEDDAERQRMAATIEDITRTLDDILSLARVGRPSDPSEPTELSALVGSVVEEYEDMGEPVELLANERLVLQARPTWMRRALRNLIGNALRYGKTAQVSLVREGGEAVITIADEGPGIASDQIERMLEPFTRGEPSRNSETGGAGLGLTLARAIAEQHGGKLILSNLRDNSGTITGLSAVLRLPLA